MISDTFAWIFIVMIIGGVAGFASGQARVAVRDETIPFGARDAQRRFWLMIAYTSALALAANVIIAFYNIVRAFS